MDNPINKNVTTKVIKTPYVSILVLTTYRKFLDVKPKGPQCEYTIDWLGTQ